MKFCRICGNAIAPFIDFGKMPISNAFLSPDRFADEYFYRMQVAVCSRCATLQVIDVPDPAQMYHDQYAYFASTSQFMVRHFASMADDLVRRFLQEPDPFVVEIGSNDGITLQNFARRGIAHLGIEPSDNVATVARTHGIDVWTDFFNLKTAQKIVSDCGQADIFIATNTMHNIEDTNGVAAGVAHLLKPKGVFVQEDPYLGNVIENVCYDQIYAEHMYIWSVASLGNAYARHGLEIFDVEPVEVHGGCMRYFVCRRGAYEPTARLLAQRAKETELALESPDTYRMFAKRCEESRDRLVALVRGLKRQNKRVVGYGATAKSTTILNYCGLTGEDIEFISDTTPAKQGKFSPGAHIPIHSPVEFAKRYPDYAVLFAWNHFSEIDAKETAFRRAGGRWIIPVRMVVEC